MLARAQDWSDFLAGNSDPVQRLCYASIVKNGALDILSAKAGIFPGARRDDLSSAQWGQVFNVNLQGTLFSVQACLPFLRKRDAGRIVVTSSIRDHQRHAGREPLWPAAGRSESSGLR